MVTKGVLVFKGFSFGLLDFLFGFKGIWGFRLLPIGKHYIEGTASKFYNHGILDITWSRDKGWFLGLLWGAMTWKT